MSVELWVVSKGSGLLGDTVVATGIISDVLESGFSSRPVVAESPKPAARPTPEPPHCAAATRASQIGAEIESSGLRKSALETPYLAQNWSAARLAAGQRKGLCS